MKLVKTGEASRILGVTPQTIRKYVKAGELKCYTTKTDQFLFNEEDLFEFLGIQPEKEEEKIAFYIRSSTGQKASLETQEKLLTENYGTPVKIYKDNGSGLNDKRPGLTKLIKDTQTGKINKIYVTHKDRLTRFGYNYLKTIFEQNHTTIETLAQDDQKTLQEELLQDFMSLIASFSGKFYRLRGYEQQKQLLNKAQKNIEHKQKEANKNA